LRNIQSRREKAYTAEDAEVAEENRKINELRPAANIQILAFEFLSVLRVLCGSIGFCRIITFFHV
jgi:hypothetical protein